MQLANADNPINGMEDPTETFTTNKGLTVWQWYKGMALMGVATDIDGNPTTDVDPRTVVEAGEAIANQAVVLDERRERA